MPSRLRTRVNGWTAAVLAVIAAVSLTLAALAPAAGTAGSKLELLEAGVQDEQYLSLGTVSSEKRACVGNRKVRFLVKRPGGTELLDVARTSDRGGWFSRVPVADYLDGGVDATTYKLTPRKAGKTRCAGDKVSPT